MRVFVFSPAIVMEFLGQIKKCVFRATGLNIIFGRVVTHIFLKLFFLKPEKHSRFHQ